jgi:methylated-DNA-protein-cysteine methyltransferase-like protein
VAVPTGVHARIHAAIRQIPRGKVATYGQIAELVGTTPRIVVFALHTAPDGVPWHRVINARGEVSARSAGDGAAEQRRLLRREGVRLDRAGRVDFEAVGWLPARGLRTARARGASGTPG